LEPAVGLSDEGDNVGTTVVISVGERELNVEGTTLGATLGATLGDILGSVDGRPAVGLAEGFVLGFAEGFAVGGVGETRVGEAVGLIAGKDDGITEGNGIDA
jgi:uncharacterized protein YcfJ